VTIPYRVCCSHMVSSPWWWPGAAALAATNNQTSRSNAVSDLLLTGTRPGEKTKGGNTMRKLGFVLVAMLAMTLVGVAYAAPSTTGIGDPNNVNVTISVVESTSLTVENDINIKLLEANKWFGVLSDLNVTTNTPVVVELADILLPEDDPWPAPYAFGFRIYIGDDTTNFGGTQDDWTQGQDKLPIMLQPDSPSQWAMIALSSPEISDQYNPKFSGDGSCTVLYVIGASSELPEAGSKYTFQVVYQLVADNNG